MGCVTLISSHSSPRVPSWSSACAHPPEPPTSGLLHPFSGSFFFKGGEGRGGEGALIGPSPHARHDRALRRGPAPRSPATHAQKPPASAVYPRVRYFSHACVAPPACPDGPGVWSRVVDGEDILRTSRLETGHDEAASRCVIGQLSCLQVWGVGGGGGV